MQCKYSSTEKEIYSVCYIKRKKSPQISNIALQLQTPETKKQTKKNILNPKQKKKGNVKIRKEISEIKNRHRQKQWNLKLVPLGKKINTLALLIKKKKR